MNSQRILLFILFLFVFRTMSFSQDKDTIPEGKKKVTIIPMQVIAEISQIINPKF